MPGWKTATWITENNAKTKLLERKNKLGKFKTDLNFMNINFFSSLKLQDMPHKHMILYLYRKEWAFTLLSFLRHFPAKNWVGLRKPIRYLQIDIRNNLFISQFVDTKFRDLLICKCVQNNPTGRVGRKVKREKSQRANVKNLSAQLRAEIFHVARLD